MNQLTSMAYDILSEEGYRLNVDEDKEGSLRSQVCLASGVFGLVLEADTDPQEITLYVYLPGKVPASKSHFVMEYFTRVNFHLPMGHFEIDLDDGQLRFVTGQLTGATPDHAMLLMLMRNALDRVNTFFPGVQRIVHGGLTALAAQREIEELHGFMASWAGMPGSTPADA